MPKKRHLTRAAHLAAERSVDDEQMALHEGPGEHADAAVPADVGHAMPALVVPAPAARAWNPPGGASRSAEEPEPEPAVAYEPEPEPAVAYEPEPEPAVAPAVAYEHEPAYVPRHEAPPPVAYEPEPAYEPQQESAPPVSYGPEDAAGPAVVSTDAVTDDFDLAIPLDVDLEEPLTPWYVEARSPRVDIEPEPWVTAPPFLEQVDAEPEAVTEFERPSYRASFASDESTAPLDIGWAADVEPAIDESAVRAAAQPEPAPVAADPMPASVVPADLLGEVRRPHEFGPVAGDADTGEPRVEADGPEGDWLASRDIPEAVPTDTHPAPRYVRRQLDPVHAEPVGDDWWPGTTPEPTTPEAPAADQVSLDLGPEYAAPHTAAQDDADLYDLDFRTVRGAPPEATADRSAPAPAIERPSRDRTRPRRGRPRAGERRPRPRAEAAAADMERGGAPETAERSRGPAPTTRAGSDRGRGREKRRGAGWVWVTVLLVAAAAAAAGAFLIPGSYWDGLFGGGTAVSAPDEDGYAVLNWPTFGGSVTEAATAPPLPSAGATAAVEASSGVDPVEAAALPYPGAPSVEPLVIRSLKPEHRYVAITIDDGIPFDTRIMDLFERHGMRATTFVLGQFASTRPDLLEKLKSHGFEVANHSWDHKDLTKLSEAGVRKELSKTQEAISAVTGDQAPYMRPPGGGYNDKVKNISADMGYYVVMWNRSMADTSKSATPEQLYHNAVDNLQPGDVILCHWGRPDTYAALAMILPELERRGYRAVTLSELIEDSGGIESLK